jgi:hypothetical protein
MMSGAGSLPALLIFRAGSTPSRSRAHPYVKASSFWIAFDSVLIQRPLGAGCTILSEDDHRGHRNRALCGGPPCLVERASDKRWGPLPVHGRDGHRIELCVYARSRRLAVASFWVLARYPDICRHSCRVQSLPGSCLRPWRSRTGLSDCQRVISTACNARCGFACG